MALALERVTPPASHRFGRRTAGRPEPLRPLHHTGYADAETLGNGPAGLPARNRRNNTLAQIKE
jgi:hypothetical protein